jgi:hypothetical protein
VNVEPSEQDCERIRQWPAITANDCAEALAFLASVWWMGSSLVGNDGDEWSFSTGGYSANEEAIGAMMDNQMLWMMTWQESRRGGHYCFKLPEIRP